MGLWAESFHPNSFRGSCSPCPIRPPSRMNSRLSIHTRGPTFAHYLYLERHTVINTVSARGETIDGGATVLHGLKQQRPVVWAKQREVRKPRYGAQLWSRSVEWRRFQRLRWAGWLVGWFAAVRGHHRAEGRTGIHQILARRKNTHSLNAVWGPAGQGNVRTTPN